MRRYLLAGQKCAVLRALFCAVPKSVPTRMNVVFFAPEKSSGAQNARTEQSALLRHSHTAIKSAATQSDWLFLAMVFLTWVIVHAWIDTLVIPYRIGNTVTKGCTLPVITHIRPLPSSEKKNFEVSVSIIIIIIIRKTIQCMIISKAAYSKLSTISRCLVYPYWTDSISYK
jgi:hypothetical protein